MRITWHEVYDLGTGIVTASSIAYSALPTVESFAAYPRFQKAYAFVMIFIVKIASLNLRAILRPAIQSTANQGGTAPLTKGPGE